MRYPDGLNLNYTYDGLGRVASVFKPGSTTYAKFNYFRDHQVKDITFGNGLVGNYTYDLQGRPASIALRNVGTLLLSLNYQYHRTGTVSSITGQSKSSSGVTLTVDERYTYDLLQRLTNATVRLGGTTTTLWYEYDSLGNRLRQSLNGQVTSYTYNSLNNQLISWSRSGTGTSYVYDNNGNLATRTVTGGTTTTWGYTWNVPGQLLKVVKDGVTQVNYAYDGLGRLLESVEGSTTTRFYAYIGTETLYEKEGSTSIDYIYAGSLRIAKVTSLSTVKYYHTDHLGSTRLVTSSTKSIIFSDGYQPFGPDNGTPTGSEAERHKFTGKPYGSNSELYYNFQRWYDPSIGRFISQDPIGGQLSDPQSHNRYVYVSNSPTVLTDPSGLAFVSISNLCWNWGTWRYEACGSGQSQSGGIMSVGEPRTGIFSGGGAASGVGLTVGAIIIADLALWGLDTLVGYLRTPPTTTTPTGDVIPKGDIVPNIVPRPPDPALKISVEISTLTGDTSATIARGRWDFEVDPGPLGRPIDLRKLARGSRTVLAICAGAVVGGFFIGTVADVFHQRSRPPGELSQPSPFRGGSGGLALGLVVCAMTAAVNAAYQSMR